MSVVLWGMGVEVDTTSSVVAFGLSRDLAAGEAVETVVANATIDQLFVIDFGYGRRKLSPADYRKYKRFVSMMRTGVVRFQERKTRWGRQFDVKREPTIKKGIAL